MNRLQEQPKKMNEKKDTRQCSMREFYENDAQTEIY